MTTTTSYGTWCNRVNSYSTSPDADVLDYINGGDTAWQERLAASGLLENIQREYRDAINDALPAAVTLCGDEFIGPYQPDAGEFNGYPVDEDGLLDFKAIVDDIDLGAIVNRNEPVTLEDIGRHILKSTAANPAKVASAALSRLGLKPLAYVPSETGRPQAVYAETDVREALAKRPGRGKRTDLKDTK